MSPCEHDGDAWDRHPALEVACPVCEAEPGKWCRDERCRRTTMLHADRDRAAVREVEGYEPCENIIGGRYKSGWLRGLYARWPDEPDQPGLFERIPGVPA